MLPVIDVHTHLAPCIADRQLEGSDSRLREAWTAIGGPDALRDPERLLGWLDCAGIDQALVCVPPPFYCQELLADLKSDWVRLINDGIVSAGSVSERLLPLAYLPLEDPGVAIAEYSRLRPELRRNYFGWTAAAGGCSVALDAVSLEPLWQLADEDHALVFLHPGESADDRLEPFYLKNLMGNPIETGVAAAQLVFGGVSSRFGNVRFVLAHCGGVVPALAGRWQQGWVAKRPGVMTSGPTPRESLRRLYVDALSHDQAIAAVAAEVFGSDHILLGSDWPFPMGATSPVDALGPLGAELVTQVCRTNPQRLMSRA